jgi:hypothetical protein
MLAEHCILKAGLSPSLRPASTPLTTEQVSALAAELLALDAWLDSCKDSPPKGYIILKKAPRGVATGGEAATPGASIWQNLPRAVAAENADIHHRGISLCTAYFFSVCTYN